MTSRRGLSGVEGGKVTPRVGKLSLNCLFAGRNNNNFDLCRSPGN